ncbi:putative methylmalonate-semialdehyde dehydrogenase [acylating] [Cardiosporidium cionae]|uniref:methylmalonate-semialdehyde dehydrogenase (CoA acylating) n=1 Tax=Cardiosporidium cionae TaxID=476202 RepID=A0ABQ7J4W7_9APIC|nr:putative methylmalonate-semialdehyde dehydrogenase [acylating] [Cardiosporidium cionae]|eukprot:KAF8817821.1 putative methylmalonate-semialdehyde dehydrogenase [acylating] [Cardiosporidium cionae]
MQSALSPLERHCLTLYRKVTGRTLPYATSSIQGIAYSRFISTGGILIDKQVPLFINNQFIKSQANVNAPGEGFAVVNPATQELLAMTPQALPSELQMAREAAATAFLSWKEISIPARQRYMLKLQAIIRDRTPDLAEILSYEQGKTIEDAKGDIFRGLEVVEYSLSGSSILMGESLENISRYIDTYSYHQPLGVCAGIAPFNFPAMIPLWMFPIACVAGNTFVLKPSERVPLCTMKLMEWCREIELPAGVVNVVHGGKPTVDFICRDSHIKAISFVGSNRAGEYIYEEGTKHGKRVQSNMGAKNHAVVMPDADKEDTLNMLCNAAFGAAGQRCMAISVVIMVGETKKWISELIPRAQTFKVGAGYEVGTDIGPLISKEAKDRAIFITKNAVSEGASLVLNGLDIHVDAYPNGNFIGPTILDNVSPSMSCYTVELKNDYTKIEIFIFGKIHKDIKERKNLHERKENRIDLRSLYSSLIRERYELR